MKSQLILKHPNHITFSAACEEITGYLVPDFVHQAVQMHNEGAAFERYGLKGYMLQRSHKELVWELHRICLEKARGLKMDVFNHMYDIAFTVRSFSENGEDVTPDMLREGLAARIKTITDEELHEACGLCDTYEEDTC